MSMNEIRAFILGLEGGETIVVDARDRTRTLKVTQPPKHVNGAYRTVGYHLPLRGYGTEYTLCIPDDEDGYVRLRYPSKPGLGERVHRVAFEGELAEDKNAGDSEPPIVSDTTAADFLDRGGDLR